MLCRFFNRYGGYHRCAATRTQIAIVLYKISSLEPGTVGCTYFTIHTLTINACNVSIMMFT